MSDRITSQLKAKQVRPKYAVVGQRLPWIEARQQVTGEAKYGVDMSLPGMLYGRVLRSPYPHARIRRIDTSEAEKLPGVKAVVTAADLPQGRGASPFTEPPLTRDTVRYVGEAVAGVAATSQDIATEALSLIKVEYEKLPAVFDSEEALQASAPRIHGVERNIAVRNEIARGDVEEGFREADCIVEDRFVTHAMAHCCLEPHVCLASFDASGKLTLWSSATSLFKARSAVAMVMGLPESKVRMVQPLVVGGHFGSKSNPSSAFFVSALLAQKTGLPVRVVNTREEEFATSHTRMPIVIELKLGARRDGTIVAKQTRVIGSQGAYSTPTATRILHLAAVMPESLYRFSNIKTEAILVYTNNIPVGPMRGFGSPQGHFALESMLDMLAENLGMDPAELRLKNATRTGDITVHGWDIASCGLNECITKSAEVMGWKEKMAARRPGRGLGMGCAIHFAGRKNSGEFAGSAAFVKVNDDGTVNLITGNGEIGTGAATILSQICTEELSLHPEDVSISAADTDVAPFACPPIASRVTTEAGNAVRLAAADARQQLFRVAAEKLRVNIKELESRERKIYVASHPEKAISIAEAARAALLTPGGGPVLGRGVYVAPQPGDDAKTWYGSCGAAYSFATDVAEVEVDTETGQVKVLAIAAARDLGTAINPMAAEGQIQGGVAQGIGYALTEELVAQDGELVNSGFTDYKIPRALDTPQIYPILVETDEPGGPFGGKGLGEIALVPTAPAIANAIYKAVGVRIKELPITPEKVLRALKEKSKR